MPSPSIASACSSRRNQRSTRQRSCTASTSRPRLKASSTRSKRSAQGTAIASSSSSSPAGGSAVESSSRERIALAKDSRKVRPIAITSPTLCMWVESRPSAPGNFSKAKRGILVTT